jgi:hypothetical protein
MVAKMPLPEKIFALRAAIFSTLPQGEGGQW